MISKLICAFCFLFSVALHAQSKKVWQTAEAKVWYNKFEWLPGLAIKPGMPVDEVEFARQYHLHQRWWDEAFAYLKNADMASLTPGTYPIDGEDVFVKVTDALSKDFDSTKWESHYNYHDIHYVISGKEMIGITPVASVQSFTTYDKERDIIFYKGDGPFYAADPTIFYIILSNQAHRPFVKIGGFDKVKRIVIKVRKDD